MSNRYLYECSTPLTGDAQAALDHGRNILASLGFRVSRKSDGELEAIGPGLNSSNQPPLLGATELTLAVSASTVTAKATLGGVRRLTLFVCIFPPALVICLLGVFAIIGAAKGKPPLPWPELSGFLVFFLMGPIMAPWILRRTRKAIDDLVYNVAQAQSWSESAGGD